MPDSEHDVPYQITTAFEWTERAFDQIRSRTISVQTVVADGVVSAVVAGPCPRCGHHLVDRQVGSAVTEVRGVRPTAVRPKTVVLDVSCGCGQQHVGAPDQVTGCGVAFRVQLTLDEESS